MCPSIALNKGCRSPGACINIGGEELSKGALRSLIEIAQISLVRRPFNVWPRSFLLLIWDEVGAAVQVSGHGPPELVTGGSDGAVRVWDVRQPGAPVAAFPAETAGPDKVCHSPPLQCQLSNHFITQHVCTIMISLV